MVIILSCNRRRRKKNDKIIAYCNGVQSVVFKAVNCLISTRGNNKYVKLKTNGNIKLIIFFSSTGLDLKQYQKGISNTEFVK